MNRIFLFLGVCAAAWTALPARAQNATPGGRPAASATTTVRLTLSECIHTAQTQSVAAMVAKYTFLSDYWAYRSYRASRLPSLHITGDVLNFDRSLRLLQNAETGNMRYVSNYNLQNTLGLSIKQNVTFTGGTLRLQSSLNRLDQFEPKDKTTYRSQPVTISYTQPLFAYNQFKWDKKIAPRQYEQAKRTYIESMEQITLRAVNLFFTLLSRQTRHAIAKKNYENTKTLYAIAQERRKLGTVTEDGLLQLELRMLNDSLAINTTALNVREQQLTVNSYLGFNENVDLEPVLDERIPAVNLDYGLVLDRALANSSFAVENEIKQLQAEAAIAKARANRGATATLSARFGLSNSGDTFSESYKGLLDQEVIGLNFSIPIFDWGTGRGQVRMAESKAEMVTAQIAQAESDYRREIYTLLEQYNNQRNQCAVAARAREVAQHRYEIAMDNFRRGSINVTEMNNAQSENDSAQQSFVTALSNFWNYYYELRKRALYDFETGTDISAEFDRLVE